MAEETSSDSSSQYRLPSATTLQHVVKISITEDKPIMLDYWTGSLDNQVLIGMRESGEKLLVKSEDEYTSTIDSIYNAGEEYIVVTENSIYLVSSKIPTRLIS